MRGESTGWDLRTWHRLENDTSNFDPTYFDIPGVPAVIEEAKEVFRNFTTPSTLATLTTMTMTTPITLNESTTMTTPIMLDELTAMTMMAELQQEESTQPPNTTMRPYRIKFYC